MNLIGYNRRMKTLAALLAVTVLVSACTTYRAKIACVIDGPKDALCMTNQVIEEVEGKDWLSEMFLTLGIVTIKATAETLLENMKKERAAK